MGEEGGEVTGGEGDEINRKGRERRTAVVLVGGRGAGGGKSEGLIHL